MAAKPDRALLTVYFGDTLLSIITEKRVAREGELPTSHKMRTRAMNIYGKNTK